MITRLSSLAAFAAFATCATSAQALEFGNINVVENDTGNATTSVTVTIPAGQSTPDFFIRPGSNRGDYNVQIGISPNDDFASGILLAAIAQNGSNGGGFSVPSVDWARSGVNAGGYWIPVNKAGASNVEWNANVSAIYFPYDAGWIGGLAYNDVGTNGGINNRLMTGGGLLADATGNHAAPWGNFFSLGGGQSIVDLNSFDSRADGIMFANHGKNEANYGMVDPVINGDGTWRLAVHDSNVNGASFEQDPIAFAFVPLGTEGVTMGTITGGGRGSFDGPGATLSQGDFTVQRTNTGTHQLEIAGQSPTSGTLLVVPVGVTGFPSDNIVTYQPNGSGWQIQSRDLPSDPPSLQDNGNTNSYSFLFVPFDNIPAAPANTPAKPFDPNAVAAANFIVTEFNPGNTPNDMFARAADGGSRGLGVIASNRGDVRLSFGGTAATSAQGILFTSLSENLRDNSATGGLVDYGVHGTSDSGGWVAHTERKNAANGEHNINFSAAFFPHSAGFQMERSVAIPGGTLALSVPGSGDSRNSGLLMVTPYGNDDNFSTVSPSADGTAWNVQLRDNSQGLEGDSFSYVFLPYGTENLIGGQISSAGYTQNRTGEFTLIRESTGVYRLSIPDKTPGSGMLLLNAGNLTGPDQDNMLSYQADGSDFLIHTLDAGPAAQTIAASFQDTAFSFAYLDFDNPVTNPQLRTFNPDAAVAGNFTVIQNDTANNATSVSVFPSFTSDDSFNVSGGNRGDYDLSLNGSRIQIQDGVIIASIAQNGANGVFSAPAIGDNANGAWIALHAATSAGQESNSNVSAAFFPFSGGWIGGTAKNSTNNGEMTSLIGSPGLLLGTHFIDEPGPAGVYTVNLADFGANSQSSGILLVTGAKNEDNYALSRANSDGTWTVFGRDTFDTTSPGGENDPVNFVYLPTDSLYKAFDKNAKNLFGIVAMGTVSGQGDTILGAGSFTTTVTQPGEIFLTADGVDPSFATLLISAAGGDALNFNNIVTFEPFNNGWLIQSRDVLSGFALESVGAEAMFSFALLSSVPEPSRALLLGIALSALLARRRRP